MDDLTTTTPTGTSPFDSIRRTRPDGTEYWSARDLMPLMAYSAWRNFEVPIQRAMRAAENQGHDITTNFAGSRKITATKPQDDFELSRFAAYLVAMNGDPNKPEVASAQAYFAVRTHEAETRPSVEPTGEELLALALRHANDVLVARDERIAAQAQVIDSMKPRAQAWDHLAATDGDYSMRDAAQILDRHPAITTGQNRLAKYLKDIGWVDAHSIPYQRQVDLGRLRSRARYYTHQRTGERVLADPQIRITPKGVAELQRLLTEGTLTVAGAESETP